MSTIGLIVVILLVVLLLGGVGGPYINSSWQPGYGLGWGGNGLIGVILIIALILFLTGYGRF